MIEDAVCVHISVVNVKMRMLPIMTMITLNIISMPKPILMLNVCQCLQSYISDASDNDDGKCSLTKCINNHEYNANGDDNSNNDDDDDDNDDDDDDDDKDDDDACCWANSCPQITNPLLCGRAGLSACGNI